MLIIPERGLAKSVTVHNSEWTALFDWVEASAVFTGSRISRAQVADVLIEENIYVAEGAEQDDDRGDLEGRTKQGFVYEATDIVWRQIKLHQHWLGAGAPFSVQGDWVEPTRHWRQVPAYSFCLALALMARYVAWEAGQRGRAGPSDYAYRGELFEQLSGEALTQHGWDVEYTGWAPGRARTLEDVVDVVAGFLNEATVSADVVRQFSAKKEVGLDLVCCRRFRDQRGSMPFYLVQCASGMDWKDKTQTPNVDLWGQMIQFTGHPQRGFVMPYSFGDIDDFARDARVVRGMLLDRYRLLGVDKPEDTWLTDDLQEKLRTWLQPRVESLVGEWSSGR